MVMAEGCDLGSLISRIIRLHREASLLSSFLSHHPPVPDVAPQFVISTLKCLWRRYSLLSNLFFFFC